MPSSGCWSGWDATPPSCGAGASSPRPLGNIAAMERKQVGDRQLDALLERLDRIGEELQSINRKLDQQEHLLRITRELANLNESLQALAYAALGHQGPQVRRRRTG